MTTQRATCWSVTINNPTDADEEQLNVARQKGWKVEGQQEKGAGGTLHYQLLVRTPQVRFSAVKKQFPRAHIEVARNPDALENYVNKEDTRDSALPTQQEMYPSLAKFWSLIIREIDLYNQTAECYNDPPLPLDLTTLDYATERLIFKGYHVESTSVNPQVRASWKRFAQSIAHRARRGTQTDRQTDTYESNIVLPVYIPNASSSSSCSCPSGTCCSSCPASSGTPGPNE